MRTTSSRDAKYLYAAAFLQAFGIQQCWVSLPYIIKYFEGSDTQAGMCLAANMGAYALIVLGVGSLVGRLNPRRLALCGSGAVIVVAAAMGAVVLLGQKEYRLVDPIWALIFFSGMFGLASAGFWAPLMGWLAIGAEGGKLNRRLSRFSLAWCSGALVSPYVAGMLIEIDYIWPLVAAVVALSLCWTVVQRADHPYHFRGGQLDGEDPAEVKSEVHPGNLRFRWMARMALLGATACTGVVRTQLPLLFKFELGYSESTYGALITFMTFASLLVYMGVGRTQVWHYRSWLLFSAQGLMLVGMTLILATIFLGWFFLAAFILGISGAFFYISHLFYGASGGKNRFTRMAIHEFTLSIGFVTGAMLGGYLSDTFGRYAPYWFAGGVVSLILIITTAIWCVPVKK